MKIKVGIIGATGYAGAELVRILLTHPEAVIAAISSVSFEGQKISDVYRYTRDSVTDISDLFEVLDCLYALGKIDLNGDNLLMIGKEEAE